MEAVTQAEGRAMADLTGQGAIVIGAETGVGPAIVEALRGAGAQVATDASVPFAYGGGDDIAAFFDRAERVVGAADILVLVAKPVTVGSFLDIPADKLSDVIAQELTWFALVMQEGARRMKARGRGRIMQVCSMSGKTGVHQHVGPYAAAKGGLIALARVMAAELGSTGVTVNSIATALFEPQVAHHNETRKAEMAKGIPVGRFGRPDEAAHAVLFLASEHAGYITGETLNMSGGRFMD